MNISASHSALPTLEQERIDQEVAEFTSIFRRLYKDRKLDFALYEGRDPKGTVPVVWDGEQVFRPQQLGADYLGHLVLLGSDSDARTVSVRLAIPPAPTPLEVKDDAAPWVPQRRLKIVYKMWPLLYERIRYQAELIREKRSVRHQWKPLLFSRGRINQYPQSPVDKRPAILIGFHWLEVGGAEKMAFDSVKWALAAGLRVFVVACVPSLQRLAKKLPDHPDVTFIRLDRYLPYNLWPQFVEQLIRDENVKIVHLHHCSALYDSLAHIRVSAPPVTVIDTTHIVEYADGGYPRISGVWTNYIDLHHVISKQLVDFYKDRFHVIGKVKLGRMIEHNSGPAILPAFSMGNGAKRINVAFVGRYTYQKRPLVLIEILRRLRSWSLRQNIELRARLVGDGAIRPAAERLVRRYGLRDTVEFLPPNTDVPALLDSSDILLVPSNNEGLALVCYEAIQHGCIPISTDVGAQSEIVPKELLVPLSPGPCVRSTVATVARLWGDPSFLTKQVDALNSSYHQVSADPTAEDVLMPIYVAAAKGEVIPV